MYKYNPNLIIIKCLKKFRVIDDKTKDVYAFCSTLEACYRYIAWNNMSFKSQSKYLNLLKSK